MSGLLLGFMILFTLKHMEEKTHTKGYSMSYSFKNSLKLKMKQKLDKPILICLACFFFHSPQVHHPKVGKRIHSPRDESFDHLAINMTKQERFSTILKG